MSERKEMRTYVKIVSLGFDQQMLSRKPCQMVHIWYSLFKGFFKK